MFFSIIIVVKNEKKALKQTITSIINQTFNDWECFIKDGDSSDGTEEYIKELHQKDKRFRVISNPDNGIYDAMNCAIEQVIGEWVIFLNAGDYLYDNKVFNSLNTKIGNNQGDIFYGDAMTEYMDALGFWKANILRLPFRMPFCHQSCLIRRELIQSQKFNTKYTIAADFEMLLTFYERGKKFINTDMVISIFNLDGVSSKKYLLNVKERYSVLAEHEISIAFMRRIFDYMIAFLKEIVEKNMPRKMLTRIKRVYTKIKYS